MKVQEAHVKLRITWTMENVNRFKKVAIKSVIKALLICSKTLRDCSWKQFVKKKIYRENFVKLHENLSF